MTLDVSLFIDGKRVADGSVTDPAGMPYALDGLTVNWGRPTTVDQPAASTCSFTLEASTDWPDPDLFGSTITLGRQVDVLAGVNKAAVFTGQITDVAMVVADDDPTTLVLSVTCDDILADLANRTTSAAARPVETAAERVYRVLDAARTGTRCDVASDIGVMQVRRITADDAQKAMVTDTLANLATSVDGVLWSTVDAAGDAMLRLESPAQRAPLKRLELVPPWVLIVDVTAAAGAVPINPCIPVLAPIEYRQTMSDLVTGLAVTYYVPDPADTTKDMAVTVTVVEPGAESPGRPWGVRRMELDTQLTSAVDAQWVAVRVLARLSAPGWRLNNLTVDAAAPPTLTDAQWHKVLDARTRNGLPVIIAPLPAWSPPASDTFTGYLEGGTFTTTGGLWSASLYVSLAQGYGTSVRWLDLPDLTTWQWQDFHSSISWSDLIGVGPPAS